MSYALLAALTTSTQTLSLGSSGVGAITSLDVLPVFLKLTRVSDGAVEVVQLIEKVSDSTGTVLRGQLNSTAITFSIGDAADILGIPVQTFIKQYYVGSPALGTTTAVHAAITLNGGPQTITTAITNPDACRCATITGNAGGNAGNVVITGTDYSGNVITDTIALSGTSTVSGVKGFTTITSIVVPTETHVGTDTVAIGVGAKIGMPMLLTRNTVVNAFLNGAPETTHSWTFASDGTEGGTTVTLSSALNGDAVIIDYYPTEAVN